MNKHGLFGDGLSHSLSPDIHKYVYSLIEYNADYSLIDFKSDDLEKHIDLLKNGALNGVNVTMPYKKAVIPYLDKLDKEAEEIDAVNTIVVENGCLKGYNTDYYGITKTLEQYMPVENKVYVILGYGGASKPLIHFLTENSAAKIYIVSRSPEKYTDTEVKNTEIKFIGYNELENLKGHIVFNTTPLGMFPNLDSCPLEERFFGNFSCAIDFIYNPHRTVFLKTASKYGLKVENGLKMLVYQALQSIELWSKISIPEDLQRKIYLHFRNLNAGDEKIYLVGLPGSGKSTLGKMLSTALGYDFVDLDVYIEEKEKMKISNIFSKYGEEKFRDCETAALKDSLNMRKTVIATGGGTVVRAENREILKNCNMVFYIDRTCEDILNDVNMSDRPLLKNSSDRIYTLYKERKDYYNEVANYRLKNSTTLKELLEETLLYF